MLLYIIARHRMTSANYSTHDVELTSDFAGGDFTEFYEQQFRASLAQAGAGSLLLEYAGQLPQWHIDMDGEDLGLGGGDFYVTRLRTYLTQDEMQEDVVIKQAATDGGFGIVVAAAPPTHARARLAGLSLVLGLAVMLAGASGDPRRLLRGGLVVAVIIRLVI